ncbi:hypothetical protein WJ96_05800 [Burkholderia ubonensis]|uniref:ATPase AAA-type core domain-containing protein n=1 Tax=Burkholderia ubonensis TaxID=101571 RepID=A0AAW3MVW6_9BURK|nr:AAA family ATPase [Burkholderia ubonensis]KVP75270.1 hypothetical protein WJ93_07595 [Burkholderia ubonensis]KVP98083.1 hypothetical protein WJ96_05800 [Burkholderia ubonensis]KVZ92780.1 hypothetical protein WL25_17460 [Burkholderia ubonensis]
MTRAYRRSGSTFWPTSSEDLAIEQTLPVGTYTVGHSPFGYYVERITDFELPGKLYGEVNRQADRIVGTFLKRPSGTGVLLSGQKGAGKTMLSKRIAQKVAAEYGIPTLVVNEAFHGDEFNAFIGGMNQPVVVLFDEFEKVYARDKQEALLTLFDGLYSSKKLFILTCNDRNRIDTHMVNRPGRLFYALDFAGLSKAFVEDYCADKLENKDNLRGVLSVAAFFENFSFDMLQALVEEMNRYGETASEAMQMLNMRPQNDEGGNFEVKGFRNGQPILCDGQNHDEVRRSPLSLNGMEVTFYAFDEDEVPEGGLSKHESYTLDVNNLQRVDLDNGHFVFGTDDPEVTVHFTRRRFRAGPVNYDAVGALAA